VVRLGGAGADNQWAGLVQLKEQFTVKALCGSKVVVRTGSPLLMSDLHKVAGSHALVATVGLCTS